MLKFWIRQCGCAGDLCGLMVKKLSDHMKRQHVERDLKKFVCELCGDRFKGQSGYQFHLAGKSSWNNFAGYFPMPQPPDTGK